MTAKAHAKYPFIANEMRDLLHLPDAQIATRLKCAVTTVRDCRRGFSASGESGWSEARTRLCRERWLAGDSAGLIAHKLGGISRSAVIGKVHRMGLAGRLTTKRHDQFINKKRKAPQPAPKPISPAAQVLKDIRRDGLPIPAPAEMDIPRVSYEDLLDHHCRWPCWDAAAPSPDAPAFCGRKKAAPGLSYCLDHVSRAFAAPQPRQRPELRVVAGKEAVAA